MKTICNNLTAYLLTTFVSLTAWCAQPKEASATQIQFYGKAETTFPIFFGAGVGLTLYDHYDFNLMYGLVPELYYNVIGEAAASFGGKSAYKDVVNAAFQNNNLIRAQGNYYFDSPRAGWLAGGAFSYLTSNGKAGVDKVLSAATGRDYSNLRTALSLAGKSQEVDLDAKIMVIDIRVGYGLEIWKDFSLKITGGVAKVISSEVTLKSGLAFESQQPGNTLMRSAEGDIESIINDNGISPTVSADISYLF